MLMVECPSLAEDLVPCSNLHVVVSLGEGVSPAAAGALPPPPQSAGMDMAHVLHCVLKTPGRCESASHMCPTSSTTASLIKVRSF